jgi:hypothetical protein
MGDYNMRIRKFMFINRPILNQLKFDEPEVTGKDFELEGTSCQTLMKFVLEKVRQIEA